MKKIYIKIFIFSVLIFIFLLFNSICISQSITWQRPYHGPSYSDCFGNDICYADNNNFYIIGNNNYPRGIYLVKINPYGDTLWTRFILQGEGVAGVSSGDGGCVVTGMWHDSPTKMYSLKMNSSGEVVWSKIYDSCETALGYRIIRTFDNKFIVCGDIGNWGYITKLDSNGNMIWQKYYPSADTKVHKSIIETIDGCYLAGGLVTDNPSDYGKGLLTKIDTSGNIIWEKQYKYNDHPVYDLVINKINQGYLMAGTIVDSITGYTIPGFFKLDSGGNVIKIKKIFNSQDQTDNYLKDTKIINNNKYIFSYYKAWDPFDTIQTYSVITDSIGNILHQKVFSAVDYTYLKRILLINNGDILFIGESDHFSTTTNNIYAVRADSNLNYPTVGIRNINSEILTDYNLFQNYPNPFNPTTNIHYEIPKSGFVKLVISDILGREIQTLVNEKQNAGSYEIKFDGSKLSSGIYFYTLKAGDYSETKKLVLLK